MQLVHIKSSTFGHVTYVNIFLRMKTTERSKSINAFIKQFISSHTNLIQLIKQVSHYISLISFIV